MVFMLLLGPLSQAPQPHAAGRSHSTYQVLCTRDGHDAVVCCGKLLGRIQGFMTGSCAVHTLGVACTSTQGAPCALQAPLLQLYLTTTWSPAQVLHLIIPQEGARYRCLVHSTPVAVEIQSVMLATMLTPLLSLLVPSPSDVP